VRDAPGRAGFWDEGPDLNRRFAAIIRPNPASFIFALSKSAPVGETSLMRQAIAQADDGVFPVRP
jgi:hypothetical protein